MLTLVVLVTFCDRGIGIFCGSTGSCNLSFIEPLKEGNTIMDLEDFIVSNILLPFGSLICCLFCTTRYGWEFDKYLEEVNQGVGVKLSRGLRWYFRIILPLILLFLAVYGIVSYFFAK